MTKVNVLIQPGPFFYEVWAGAMKAQGRSITDFAKEQGFALQNLKPMATGATNGEKSKKIRKLMLESVGQETFQSLYEMRLRNAGLLK